MLDSLVLALLLTLSVPGNLVEDPVSFPDLGLTLTLPPMDSLVKKEKLEKACRGEWTGEWNGLPMRVGFFARPNADLEYLEPEDVVEAWCDAEREMAKPGKADEDFEYTFERVRSISAPVGCTPILALVRASVKRKDDPTQEGLLLIAGGLLLDSAWALRIDMLPGPDEAGAAALVKHMEGCVRYQGKLRDPAWTDAEALAYWKAWAPESTHKKFEKPVRTKNLIFLTNSTSPGIYVKMIDKRFASIAKVLPVDELEGRKLLPVLLFRTDDDYQTFYRTQNDLKPADDVEGAGETQGHVYATSCDRGSEYAHAIDVAELYLRNRRRVWAGGHWFTAGLSEYVSSTPKDRLDGLRAVKKGKYTPLAKLLDDEAWGNEYAKLEKKGASEEAGYWEQSGMWMEFLREGPWPKDAFQRLVDAVGIIPYGEGESVLHAIETTYGMDLPTLEKKWVQYFSKR